MGNRFAIAHLVGRGADADIALAEGSMGLFDGVAARGVSGTGATADIAEMLGWPVLHSVLARAFTSEPESN